MNIKGEVIYEVDISFYIFISDSVSDFI
jgi:hypothetical protein